MPKRPGPTLRRRKLGKELQSAREQLKMTTRQLATEVGLQAGTISKIENAKQAILIRNVKLIGRELGMSKAKLDSLVLLAANDDTEDWLVEFRSDIPNWFGTYADLEPESAEIWSYTSELVHGLAQTPQYAEAIIQASFPDVSNEQLRRTVELRQARQAMLDRDDPPRLHLLLNEAVVRRTVGNETIMREQVRHLVTLADRSHITVQILPFAAGAHPGMKTSFTMLQFPEGFDDMDCVYMENENGSIWQEHPGEIGRYTEVFDRVRNLALSPEDTIELLDTLG